MSTIEERLKELINADDGVTCWTICASIAEDFTDLIRCVDLYMKLDVMSDYVPTETTAHEMNCIQQEAWELGTETLARVKGE